MAIKRAAEYTSSLGAATRTAAGKPRRASRAGIDTRNKLLNAAERLFAEKGYDGTSLRDIADSAKQHLALSTYHFGTKEGLFEEVIKRRALELEEIRLGELEKIKVGSISRSAAVRALIEAYCLPLIRVHSQSNRQWQAHVRLLSQIISVQRWVPLVRKCYDNCARQYIAKFEQALPHANPDDLLDSFSFMIATMLYVCSYTNRFDEMKSSHPPMKTSLKAATENFVRHTHAGFMSL